MYTGIVMSLLCFKKKLVKTLFHDENIRFHLTIMLYKSLKLYRMCIPEIKMHAWWTFANANPRHGAACRTLMRLLCQEKYFDGYPYKSDNSLCKHCSVYEQEGVSHILFSCEHFEETRIKNWNHILQIVPHAMKNDLLNMNRINKTHFILSAMFSVYVKEWNDIYIALCQFVNNMYGHN